MTTTDDVLPLTDEDDPNFDPVAFGRGYDRRQVDEYIYGLRREQAEHEARAAEDAHRLAALQQEMAGLQERLGEAERRAAGLPESATRIGQRLAQMLAHTTYFRDLVPNNTYFGHQQSTRI